MSKFGNKKVKFDGKTFDSKKEKERYVLLRHNIKLGLIDDLQCQVAFVLAPSVKFRDEKRAKPALRYFADFTYRLDGELIVEDVKSPITRQKSDYRIKKHLMKSVHNLEINEL